MLLTNRLFERQPPSKEAKSIYIFCEGQRENINISNILLKWTLE